MTDSSCLFCRIASGDIPADTVGESDRALAFRDNNPQAPTHALVIPKRHVATLPELAASYPDDAIEMLTLAQAVAEQEGVGEAYRLACNNGAGAGQSVFHAHVHVLGGRELTWPPG